MGAHVNKEYILRLLLQEEPLWYFEDTLIPDFDAIFEACQFFESALMQGKSVLTSVCHQHVIQALEKVICYQCPLSGAEYNELDYDDQQSVLFLDEIETAIVWLIKDGFSEQPVRHLIQLVQDEALNEQIRCFSLELLSQQIESLDPDTQTKVHSLLVALSEQYTLKELQQAALLSLIQYFPDHSDTWPQVQGYILAQTSPTTRQIVCQTIAFSLTHRQDVLTWLIDTIRSNTNLVTQSYCLGALEGDWENSESVFNLCLDYLVRHDLDSFRQSGVRLLGRFFPNADETKIAVVHALKDPDMWVREEAVKLLPSLAVDPKDVQNLLQQCVDSDLESLVQETALELLIEHISDPDGLIFWLKTCAHKNHNFLVRIKAIEALSELDFNDHLLFQQLSSLYQQEEHAWVREALVKQVARYCKQPFEKVSWLQGIAEQDPDEGVRYQALSALSFHSE
ncbi:HEAT repeat domain-containing protein [Litoribrevibacter albus]|uniref:HEAT repeat domain-containing protein n=1 Tax=Litoribrevibacter albus TaxID=1473156 RepID=A0AA37W747_9GAMM|nr:HEAT repeat domain-containing protein [Litoribrevibacter albus]GLQ30794.1 hypothetical protein GCM10007876_12730 [Litoribrevibacter albus]